MSRLIDFLVGLLASVVDLALTVHARLTRERVIREPRAARCWFCGRLQIRGRLGRAVVLLGGEARDVHACEPRGEDCFAVAKERARARREGRR